MLKLSSATVGKIVLGIDFEHFTSIDAPLHRMPLAIAQSLALNKKITSMGEWYSHLPFGDPKRLKDLQAFMAGEIGKVIAESKGSGTEDLPLQDAALKAANLVDYLTRAVDNSGNRLPTENMAAALTVAAGAGFTTTSSLLSWLIFGLVTYPGMQERLVQELVNHGFKDDEEVAPELIEELEELDKYVKEMQRKHNPSYQPGRTAQKDLILPGGLRMHKGEVIIAALHHIHNNPKVWENPDRFDPDRWDTEKVKKRGRTDYIPFAAGQRMCVGFNFALQEIKIFIAQLVWRYEWIKDGNVETEYDPFFQLIRQAILPLQGHSHSLIINRPVNLYVRTKRRTVYPSKSI
ncbi:putative cytochrome P450 monooxygenase [Aureobasidium sp. EXF-8845]|nr:putative cytochrome P450 monooxygenase [Aureobasidium sp. EXF-8846]KAI4846814.1 putative cytochrome P450 monooxygenase [Aureobasidium sp. EXF-8845]